jgi:hypothetical protein
VGQRAAAKITIIKLIKLIRRAERDMLFSSSNPHKWYFHYMINSWLTEITKS